MTSFAIVPAAGRSVRMGQPKLLLPWQDATIIECVLRAWIQSRVDRVIVIVRPDDERLAEIVRRYAVDLLIPPKPPPEMRTSVEHGLRYARARYLPTDEDVWLLAPADMPNLSPEIIDRLLAEHVLARPEILIPSSAGQRGHPVLFPWPLAVEAESLPVGWGLNALVTQHSAARYNVREIPVQNSAILDDIDTPDQYRRGPRDGSSSGGNGPL